MYEVELLIKNNKECIMRSVTEIDFKFPWKSIYAHYRNLSCNEDCIAVFKKDDIVIRLIELRKDDNNNVYCC